MPHRTQQRTRIVIVLADNGTINGKRNKYRGGDDLEGFVEISAPNRSPYDIRISLEGTIRTWLGYGSTQSDNCVRTGEFKFLREVQNFKAEKHNFELAEHEFLCRTRFRFRIPEQLISARSNIPSDYLNLPPSTQLGQAFKGNNPVRTYMHPRIVYSVVANLVNRDGNDISLTLHDELEVQVMPSTKASPPLQLAQYPAEFTITSQSLLRRHIWSRSMGNLHVSSCEPEAINLAVLNPMATTLAIVKMTLTQDQHFAASLRPYEWEIVSKSWLRARTFYSTKVSGKLPNIPSLEKDPFLQMHTETTDPESRNCNSLGWRLDRLSARGTIGSEEALSPWTTYLRIPINCSKHLLPTFLTPLAAHRYSICISLSITGFSHRSLYLEVPVQVVYDATQRDNRMKDEEELIGMMAPLTMQDSVHSPEQPPEYSYFY